MTDQPAVVEVDEDGCITCGEDHAAFPPNECTSSRRACGHHCNCSWIHDHCHWCGATFGEDGKVTFDSILDQDQPAR